MKIRYLYLATLTATLVACSSVSPGNTALDQAGEHFRAAQLDVQTSRFAPDELRQAGESLRVALQAWEHGDKTSRVDHLAYLTEQRVLIARETASDKASQAVTASAAAERNKLRLEERTIEADTAQQQLAVAQQINLQKDVELDKAKDKADRDKAALDSSTNDAVIAGLQLAQAQQDDERRSRELELSGERVNDLEYQLRELNARPTPRGMVVTLGDVLFDTGKSSIQVGGGHNLAKLAEFFMRNPLYKATIEGYTDNVGSASSNQDLAARRADAVMAMLLSMGVPADRLHTHAYGEENPVADNGSVAGRQMNRRVEIVFDQQSGDVSTR